MAQVPMKVKLPKRLIKALGLKPGNWLHLIVTEEGDGIVVAEARKQHHSLYSDEEWERLWEALEAVTGIWANRTDIPDSRTYVRQLRQGWQEGWETRQRWIFSERRQRRR